MISLSKFKTPLLIIIFLLFSAFLGFLLYRLFFVSSIDVPTQTDGKNYEGGLPSAVDGEGNIISDGKSGSLSLSPTEIQNITPSTIAKGGVTETVQLVNDPVLGFSVSNYSNNAQYYNQSDGKFYQVDENGNTTLLSNKVFYNVENVTWSNTDNKAIIEYPDGANIIYNFNKDDQVTLPKHWEDFEFAPNEDKIVAKSMGLDPDNRWLTVSNDDGSSAKYIEPLGEKDSTVYTSWSPNNQTVAMFTEGTNLDRQEVYFVGLNGENFKSTTIEGRGFESIWSPDGARILYSVYSSDNDMKPSLWTVSAQGETINTNRKSLGLETWASKCTFSDNTNVYCAVPRELKEGSGLFKELAESTSDVVYKINVLTGLKKLIAIPDKDMTITNIYTNKNETTLFYTDASDNSVYKINL